MIGKSLRKSNDKLYIHLAQIGRASL